MFKEISNASYEFAQNSRFPMLSISLPELEELQ